jgi:transposase-like protein
MKKAKIIEGRKCPECGKSEKQVMAGKNRSGTQRCFCNECKKYYTYAPKTHEIPEEIRQQAIKTYYAGTSGRGVGKIFGFSKANVYNWIKKTAENGLPYFGDRRTLLIGSSSVIRVLRRVKTAMSAPL